jgi:hypothetical protein
MVYSLRAPGLYNVLFPRKDSHAICRIALANAVICLVLLMTGRYLLAKVNGVESHLWCAAIPVVIPGTFYFGVRVSTLDR